MAGETPAFFIMLVAVCRREWKDNSEDALRAFRPAPPTFFWWERFSISPAKAIRSANWLDSAPTLTVFCAVAFARGNRGSSFSFPALVMSFSHRTRGGAKGMICLRAVFLVL